MNVNNTFGSRVWT